jgi:hypothetical protein
MNTHEHSLENAGAKSIRSKSRLSVLASSMNDLTARLEELACSVSDIADQVGGSPPEEVDRGSPQGLATSAGTIGDLEMEFQRLCGAEGRIAAALVRLRDTGVVA